MPYTLTFPVALDRRGKFAVDQDRQSRDRSQLLFVLGTAVGERVMRPSFGASIEDAIASIPPDAMADGGANKVQEMKDQIIGEMIRNVFDRHFPNSDITLVDVKTSKSQAGNVLYVDVFWAYQSSSAQSETFSGRLNISKYKNQLPGE